MTRDRRKFLKQSLATAAGLTTSAMMPFSLLQNNMPPNKVFIPKDIKPKPTEAINFGVIGINHGHIYGMAEALIEGGGTLISVYAKEADLLTAFAKKFPNAKIAKTEAEIIEDPKIQLIACAAIPIERAPLGIRVMQAGKDFMSDKPGILNFSQLEEVKKTQKETNRIYSIMYSERLGNPASVKAGELVKSGAVGKVVQTIGLGPHRMRPASRPDWFFDPEKAGGILCDIGSHQCDQFLYYTNSQTATVNFSQVGNFGNAAYPNYRDFGDMAVRSDHATGYIRIDWFTPEGLNTWGDGRTFILGTEGYIEMRKYTDIAGRNGGNHLFLINQKETVYFDCGQVHMPYGQQLVSDVVNRTETAMAQAHCFLATELALKGQQMAFDLTV